MKKYDGFTKDMVSENTFNKNYKYTMNIEQDMIIEPSPYLNRTAISKGAVQFGTLSGTIFNTGLFTGGTIRSTSIGSSTFVGTINNSIVGTPTITGGIANQQTLGTPMMVGGTINNVVLGTPTITGGSITDKIVIGTGANSSIGLGTLAAGIATILTTKTTANSFVFLTPRTNNINIGVLSQGTIVAGTSFVVNSSNALDNDVFNWLLIN